MADTKQRYGGQTVVTPNYARSLTPVRRHIITPSKGSVVLRSASANESQFMPVYSYLDMAKI